MKIMTMISLIMRIIMMTMIIVMMMTMKTMMMTKIMMMKTTMMMKTMMTMMIIGEETLVAEEVPVVVTSKETVREDSLQEEEEDPDPVQDLGLVQAQAPDLAHQEEEGLLQVPEMELREEVLLP